jgi:hypothetical protein
MVNILCLWTISTVVCGAWLVSVSVGTVFFVWKPPSKWPVQTPSREGGATVGDVPPSCKGRDFLYSLTIHMIRDTIFDLVYPSYLIAWRKLACGSIKSSTPAEGET